MCNQSVGLVQAALESAGIVTVSLSLLRRVSEKVRPPRVLYVPFPMGCPLGEPNNPKLQMSVIRAALQLVESDEPLPILRDFVP